MKVELENNGKKGSFFIEENNMRVATMSFTFAGETKFIIDHTEVDPSQSGKGLGRILLNAAVDYARKNNLKIMPLCPYAKSVFDKYPDLADVLF